MLLIRTGYIMLHCQDDTVASAVNLRNCIEVEKDVGHKASGEAMCLDCVATTCEYLLDVCLSDEITVHSKLQYFSCL